MVCTNSSIEVTKKNELLVCTECCRAYTARIIIELVFNFIWVSHRRRIGINDGCRYFATQRKSQWHKVVIDAFWKSGEFTDNVCFGGESYSSLTPLLIITSSLEECIASTNQHIHNASHSSDNTDGC